MIQAAQDLLKTTLAASASFRTFCGAADATAALLKIHHDYWPDPTGDVYSQEEIEAIWPCALIFTVPDRGWNYDRDAAGTNNWAARGELVCVLQQSFPLDDNGEPEASKSEAEVDLKEAAGNIIENLVDMSETAGYLACTGFTVSGPFRTQPDETSEAGDQQAIEIHIRWGNR